MKGFYRQRKKKGGVAKAKAKPSKNKPQQDCGSHGEEEEELLRRFDMDMTYGPCIGITRLQRWERAAAMGLCPPPRLRELLLLIQHRPAPSSSSSPASKSISTGSSSTSIATTSLQPECVWAGKV
ncbi:hypothetical protein ABZP36_030260 [Zizania latifolia]